MDRPTDPPHERADFRRPAVAFALITAAVAVATLLRLAFDPLLGEHAPYATFFVAVAFATWLAGLGGALFASLLALVVVGYTFLPPRLSWSVDPGPHVAGMFVFLAAALAIGSLGEAVQRARRRAEAARAATHAQTLATLESIADAFVAVDAEWRLTYVNRRAEAIYRRSRAELLGRSFWDEFPEALGTHWEQRYREAMATRVPTRVEGEYDPFGSSFEVDVFPVSDGGLSFYFRDIGRMRADEREIRRLNAELRERVDELQVLLEIMPTGVWWSDASCETIRGNRTAYEMLGLERGANASLSAPDVRSGAVRPFHCEADGRVLDADELPMQVAARTGQPVLGQELDVVLPDGTRRSVVCNVAPLAHADGTVRMVLGAYSDVTSRKAAEAELRLREQELRLCLAVARMGTWEFDHRTLRVVTSGATDELYGIEPGSERTIDDYMRSVHPDDSPRLRAESIRAAESGEPIQIEYRLLRPDGAIRWIASRGDVVKDEDGNVVRMVGALVDITERKLAEEELRRESIKVRRLVDSNILGVVFCDETHIHEANDAFLAIVGRTRGELAAGGLDWRRMTAPEYEDADETAMREVLATGGSRPFQKEYLRPDGSRVPALLAAALIEREPPRFVCFVQDMTPIKRVEDELRIADRRKDTFIATLAHELRNPLAPMRNALRVLRADPHDEDVAAWAHGVLDRQTRQMARLLEDLLDVSRITLGKLELRRERVTLEAIVEQAIDTSRPALDAAGHSFRAELPAATVELDVDPVRIAQVVANLLNNAAKYTDPGGTIRLFAHVEGSAVEIVVEDDGIGIAPQMLPTLFDMFSQGPDALERGQGGLGIGLGLARELVALHGGEIRAESGGPRRGSRFAVRLPLPRTAPARPSATAPPDRSLALPPLKILIADDNVDAAETLGTLLGVLGHEVRLAHDGEAAVEAAAEFGPDAVLLDIGMPRLDGYGAARAIRAEVVGRSACLVALTGWGQPEDRRRAEAAGFDAHLVKPVEFDALLEVLRTNGCGAPAAGGRAPA